MLVQTTYKCGCPEPLSLTKLDKLRDFLKEPCSPCCPPPPKSCESKAISARSATSEWKRSSSGRHVCAEDEVPSTTKKVVSHIVKKGQPYKEIEAIFNGNRVIIRTQREPLSEKFDPPCECIDDKSSEENLTRQEGDVAFHMDQGSLELQRGRTTSEETDCKKPLCRTITLYPEAEAPHVVDHIAHHAAHHAVHHVAHEAQEVQVKKDPMEKRPIDLEENPNIFLLRIRKHSSGNKTQKLDFEFRAPRPWRETCK